MVERLKIVRRSGNAFLDIGFSPNDAPYVLRSGDSGSELQCTCTRRGAPGYGTPTRRRSVLCFGRFMRKTDKPSPGKRILPDKSDNTLRVHVPVRRIPIGSAAEPVLLVNAVQQLMPENHRQVR